MSKWLLNITSGNRACWNEVGYGVGVQERSTLVSTCLMREEGEEEKEGE